MKDHSIRKLFEASEAALSKAASEQRKQANQQKQKFYSGTKTRRSSFMEQFRKQEQKYNEKLQLQNEKVLKSFGWDRVFSNDTEAAYYNKNIAGCYVRINGDTFAIYRNPKNKLAGFEGDTPEVGPLNTIELEDQLKTFVK
jgi:hypothetical protein